MKFIANVKFVPPKQEDYMNPIASSMAQILQMLKENNPELFSSVIHGLHLTESEVK